MSALSEQCEVLRLWAKQLRESEPILASDLREAADTILNLRDTAQQAQSENAKLRKLVSLYHYGATHEASPSDVLAWSCKVDSLRRELGIEAEE